MELDQQKLIQWFLSKRRSFPWRQSPSPYHVWVSEVMLQQTRASVVVPYFSKWIERFPTVASLSQASEEEVIKLWEGLGYYSRARNLLFGAKELMSRFGGELPKDPQLLASIKGVGPYTVGAILSLAFGLAHPAVDGNVLRVASRHFHIEQDITKASTKTYIESLIKPHIPLSKPGFFNEALIELGATLCTPKKPKCNICPLATTCLAKRKGVVHQLPVKKKKEKPISLFRSVAVIQYQNQFLVQKGCKGQMMEGLYEFPYFERDYPGHFEKETLFDLEINFPLSLTLLPSEIHTFTRYKATLFPIQIVVNSKPKLPKCLWKSREALLDLPFSAGHRKILVSLLTSSSKI